MGCCVLYAVCVCAIACVVVFVVLGVYSFESRGGPGLPILSLSLSIPREDTFKPHQHQHQLTQTTVILSDADGANSCTPSRLPYVTGSTGYWHPPIISYRAIPQCDNAAVSYPTPVGTLSLSLGCL